MAKKGVTRVAKGLMDYAGDMSTAARMRRAAKQGFDKDVFHGTAKDILRFDAAARGTNTKARSAKNAFWFTDDADTAASYAKMAAEDSPVQQLLDASMAAERRGDWDAAHDLMVQAEQLEPTLINAGGQNVMPLKLRGNFMQVDADGATLMDLDESQIYEWTRQARKEGFDGLQVDNLSDNADWGNYRPATHYAVFKPENIRSVNAAFDPAKADSSDILASIGNLAPYAVAGAGAYSALSPEEAEASIPAEDIDIEKSIRVGEFVRRRAQKNAYWEGVKALGGLGSLWVGGTVAGLSTIPGYLNPLQSNEATEAGADWVADKLTYTPEDNAYMQGLGEILNSATSHLQPYFEQRWPHSLPGKVWNSLPESTRGLLLGASEVL